MLLGLDLTVIFKTRMLGIQMPSSNQSWIQKQVIAEEAWQEHETKGLALTKQRYLKGHLVGSFFR